MDFLCVHALGGTRVQLEGVNEMVLLHAVANDTARNFLEIF